MSVVEVNNLTKLFGSGHTAVKAVNGISLKIEAGDIVLIMGPSGSGKTTLISMIGTLLKPTEGQIVIDGEDTAKLTRTKLADLRLHKLGFMFQSFNLLSALTAEQNVTLPLLVAGTNKKQAKAKAQELLEKLHLEKRLNNLPKNLSGGEKQRVAVARVLANEPQLILADEPTANLDSKTGHEVMQLLCQTACSENRAVIIVSHDQRLKDVAKRVITIEDGRLVREEKGNHTVNCPLEHKHGN
ncbi:ABC transporter ATP-binding protein [Candidatus Saccharibacteria bacterium]|nr:ABC transporter ATP-binding protein [Candidatus Saccharibacteria bacterium]